MLSLPSLTLAHDLQPFVVRTHRLRGAVTATLIRDFIRWISVASR
jgi:hypothetical protein